MVGGPCRCSCLPDLLDQDWKTQGALRIESGVSIDYQFTATKSPSTHP